MTVAVWGSIKRASIFAILKSLDEAGVSVSGRVLVTEDQSWIVAN